jgi:hypothetical protein
MVATAAENRLSFRRRNPHVVGGSWRLPSNREFLNTRPSVMGPMIGHL